MTERSLRALPGRGEVPSATSRVRRGSSWAARLDQVRWSEVEAALEEQSYARLGRLLTAAECGQLKALYPEDRPFRSRVDMERHRFGAPRY